MKNQIFIIIVLILGLSHESFAKAGRASDEFVFSIVILGFLLVVLGLLSGVDYLEKNGRKLLFKTLTSIKKLNTLFKGYSHKLKSIDSEPSYF